jgi:hypothetical protein
MMLRGREGEFIRFRQFSDMVAKEVGASKIAVRKVMRAATRVLKREVIDNGRHIILPPFGVVGKVKRSLVRRRCKYTYRIEVYNRKYRGGIFTDEECEKRIEESKKQQAERKEDK